MKVIELIEELKKYPSDLKVCMIDYDYGCFEITGSEIDEEHIEEFGVGEQSDAKEQVVVLS
jgi:hypothetical protein